VKYLSSDFAGRPWRGNKGGDLATEYIARQLAAAGAKPAGEDGTYFQKVPLVGVATQPETEISASGRRKRSIQAARRPWWASTLSRATADLRRDAVFVGHGITAPEWNL